MLPIRTTETPNPFGRTLTIRQIVRAELSAPTAIVRQMASDLRGMLAGHGGVTPDDLKVVGWSGAQIKAHLEQAIDRARRAARTDGGEG